MRAAAGGLGALDQAPADLKALIIRPPLHIDQAMADAADVVEVRRTLRQIVNVKGD